jgi:F-type H+-transporting ATPase subunit delta
MQNTLASRYARALAEAVRERAPLEKCAAELEILAGAIRQSKSLREFLLNPNLPDLRKTVALASIAKRVGLSETTGRLVEILLKKRRIDLLPDISDEFRRMEEQALNRVSVEVTTAIPLDPALQKKLAESLGRFTGKSIRLEPRVDPAVLGGARARIGSVIYDGTVAGRMRKLKQQLIGDR